MATAVIYRKNPNYIPGGPEPEMLPAEEVANENPASVLSWDEFDFRKRFTADERKAIKAAAAVDADVDDFIEMLSAAGRTGTRIMANDEMLNAALDALTTAGLLALGRKAEILGSA